MFCRLLLSVAEVTVLKLKLKVVLFSIFLKSLKDDDENSSSIDTVGVLTSTDGFQNFGLLDQVKLVYPRDQPANLIILSHQARQEQLDSWQLGAKKMEK